MMRTPKPELPAQFSVQKLPVCVCTCIMYTSRNCKNAQNCMILRTKFQFFSGGNTPALPSVGEGDGSVHPSLEAEPQLAFFSGYSPGHHRLLRSMDYSKTIKS